MTRKGKRSLNMRNMCLVVCICSFFNGFLILNRIKGSEVGTFTINYTEINKLAVFTNSETKRNIFATSKNARVSFLLGDFSTNNTDLVVLYQGNNNLLS